VANRLLASVAIALLGVAIALVYSVAGRQTDGSAPNSSEAAKLAQDDVPGRFETALPVSPDAPSEPTGPDRPGESADNEALVKDGHGAKADAASNFAPGDYPSYLEAVVGRSPPERDPQGCRSIQSLLAEMADEQRDELWAARVERDLRELLGRHPLGFTASVGCRATICQVSNVGVLAALETPANAREDYRYWKNFREDLLASPVAVEFSSGRAIAGNFMPDPDQHIVAYVFTSTGRGSAEEPTGCGRLAGGEE
jgi:hypothetical protein